MITIPIINARWLTRVTGNVKRKIQVIVIHSMEAPEKGTTAEACARYFATTDRKASAHYCIDNNSIVQCMMIKNVAYGAKGFNRAGLHLEHAGYARQTREDWLDEYSTSMLKLSAQLCREILIPRLKIDVRQLSEEEIRAISHGDKIITGFCTHAQITHALRIKGGHTDPGVGFPMNQYLEWVKHG